MIMIRIQATVQTTVEQFADDGAIASQQPLQPASVIAMSPEAWLRQWDATGRAIIEALGLTPEPPSDPAAAPIEAQQ